MRQMAAKLGMYVDPYHNKAIWHSVDVVNDFAGSHVMLCQEL